MLLAWFITERAIPFIGFWEDAIDEVETGGSLTIAPGDVPAGGLSCPHRSVRYVTVLPSGCVALVSVCSLLAGRGWYSAVQTVTTDGSVSQNRETLPADRGKNTREFGSPIHRSPD